MTSSLQVTPPLTAPTAADWCRASHVLRAARQPVLLCHVGPDGDALGSMLAMVTALRSVGIPAVASWGEDAHVIPAAYTDLAGQQYLIPASDVPAVPDVVMTFDSGSADRLGSLADRLPATLAAGGEVVVVDHHASNAGFGSLHLVDPAAAATAVLVERLLQELAIPLTAEIAESLYVGLVTDTGAFRYAATTPSVHAMAGRLLATGIDHAEINRRIWDSHPFGYLSVLGTALARVRLDEGAAGGLGMVWTWLTGDDLSGAALGLDAVEGVIDVIRTADEAEIAGIAKQGGDGVWRVSLRSKGRLDVGRVAALLGGGGHRFAAGFSSGDPVDELLDRLRAALAVAPHLSR